MIRACVLPLLGALTLQLTASESRPAGQVASAAAIDWIAFPDPRLEVRGLPWFAENSPELWRLPKSAKGRVPPAVWTRGVAPDGGRIRFSSTSTTLLVRVEVVTKQKKLAYFDAYIDSTFAGSAGADGPKTAELRLFEKHGVEPKNVTIYLPNTTQVRVLAIGVDHGAAWGKPPPFSRNEPLMCYGSSVLQGTGAEHPANTYPAQLARRLNLDFVNLGFGGAGKAEPNVVALVNGPPACGYLFDLGKSYGAQSKEPFVRMLNDVRAAHPAVPIFVVTPIYSTFEETDKAYLEKSKSLRVMMRGAAEAQAAAGDQQILAVEGLALFGPNDRELFHDPQHPNDAGNQRITERLVPIVESRLRASDSR